MSLRLTRECTVFPHGQSSLDEKQAGLLTDCLTSGSNTKQHQATSTAEAQKLKAQLVAIDEVRSGLKVAVKGSYANTISQIGGRLKKFLEGRQVDLQTMISDGLGEQEIISGNTTKQSTRDLYKNALRTILDRLCEKGLISLAYNKCMFPAVEMNPNRDPRGLRGFPEAVTGIYPAWLVPERFRRGIENNAAIAPEVRKQFRDFAEFYKDDLNEASLLCYWNNLQVLAKHLDLRSLEELAGDEGIRKLQKVIEDRGFTRKTSVVNHWRKMLRHTLGGRNPFDQKNEFGDYLLRLPKPRRKPVIKEGATFRRNKKRHKVIHGEIMEERIPMLTIKRLLNTPITSTEFAEYQQDVIGRTLAIIKERPIETWAHNHKDYKLVPFVEGDEESMLYAGDGHWLNNFRESIRKTRTDKPFPKWLATRLEKLWQLRRAYFEPRGNGDLRADGSPGLLRAGIPQWVDPRTGRRASQGQIRSWLRLGLIRAGMKPEIVEHVTGYWFRRGVITAEYFSRDMVKKIAKTSGHSEEVAERDYLGYEMPAMVAHERENYWKPMGIAGNLSCAERQPPRSTHEGLEPVEVIVEEAVGPAAADLIPGAMAAKRLKISLATLARWAEAGLIKIYPIRGRNFCSGKEIDAFRGRYVTAVKAAKLGDVSDGYVRRLCRQDRIPGLKRVGRKTYLIPVEAALRIREL